MREGCGGREKGEIGEMRSDWREISERGES